MTFKTADLCDVYEKEIEVCRQVFQTYGKRKKFAGPISTVQVFEDNVLVVESLKSIPKGNILVIDGAGSNRCALLGDKLAGIAVSQELAGIIVYGCVRDTVDLAKMDVGILALGSNPLRSNKEGKGKRDIPVTFGEITWRPGHHAYVDEDGVIVAEQALI